MKNDFIPISLYNGERQSFAQNLKELELKHLPFIENLEAFILLKGLEKITISNCPNLTDLKAIIHFKNLKYLTIEDCNSITDLSPINEIEQLLQLRCLGFPDLEILKSLKDNEKIKKLDLLQDRKSFAGFFNDVSPTLYIYFKSERVIDLKPLESLQKIDKIGFHYCSELKEIESLKFQLSLTSICFNLCDSIEDVNPISNLKNLKTIKFHDCEKIKNIDCILKIGKLEKLHLEDCKEIKDLNFQKENNLTELRLHSNFKLIKLNNLSSLIHLKILIIEDCISFFDIDSIGSLTNLEELGLFYNRDFCFDEIIKKIKKLKILRVCSPSFRLNKTFHN